MSRTNASAPAVLVVVAGPVASGKSTIASALAHRIGAECIEADRVRGTLLAATAPDSAGAEARWRRDLSAGFEEEIYTDLLRRAAKVLDSGCSLVLDACFPRRAQRTAARELARNCGVRFLFVECRVDDETIRARLAARDRAEGLEDRAGWTDISRRIAERSEPPEELPLGTVRLNVHSDGATEPVIDEIVARLAEMPTPSSRNASVMITPLPRAVTFDCWNTLLAEEDWPWAHELRVSALAEAAREAGAEPQRDVVSRALDAAWQRHHENWVAGRATGAHEVAEWGLAELELEPTPLVLEHLVHRFEEASHTSRVVAIEDAVALTDALSRLGVGCALVCDTGLTPGRVVRRLLDRTGLLKNLEAFAFSDEVGVAKPDSRMFLAALAPLDVAPEDALHVGDLRRTDIAGAHELGMRSVRISARHDDRTELPEAQYVVESHAELASLLGIHITGG